ncbi:unnamed protein product, partial [Choristocarpus tenellus]
LNNLTSSLLTFIIGVAMDIFTGADSKMVILLISGCSCYFTSSFIFYFASRHLP